MPVQRSNSFTPRGPKKKGAAEKLDVFDNMRKNGAGFGEALFSMFKGHMMTEEQAAVCVQAYWRRYQTMVHLQYSRGAAITMQAAYRGHRVRGQMADAAAEEAARLEDLRGQYVEQATEAELEEQAAVTVLQAAWRAHLARVFASKLRSQDKTRLKRSFSWKKGKTSGKSKTPSRQLPAAASGGRKDDDTAPKTRIKRALSFDRVTRPWGNERVDKGAGKGKDADAPKPAQVSKQLLFILLHRGPTGLGLELDATNTIVNIVRGGAADRQGYFMVGDTIASVDGVPLRGRLLQEVMDRNKSSYSFDVWRLRKIEPDPEPAKTNKPVRRAFSFDRKRSSR